MDTFTLLAEREGWKNDDRGKREWTGPERNENEKPGYGKDISWSLELKNTCSGCNIYIYAEYMLNFLKWEFNEASLMTS